jgi:hypothetical protein
LILSSALFSQDPVMTDTSKEKKPKKAKSKLEKRDKAYKVKFKKHLKEHEK